MKQGSFTPNEYRVTGDVVWIKLTQKQETCVDLTDWEKVRAVRWYAQKSKGRKSFYAVMSASKAKRLGCPRLLHQWLLNTNEVDHEDRNGLNNRRKNIRPATRQQNVANQGLLSTNSSGFRGVSFRKDSGRWRARIMLNGSLHCLGTFSDRISAARAYDKAALACFAEFASLNLTQVNARWPGE